jgi:hypothetical protein
MRQTHGGGKARTKRPGGGKGERADRWPSDYGKRAQEDARAARGSKRTTVGENVDEQGERANVRQNTPPKGLRSKR